MPPSPYTCRKNEGGSPACKLGFDCNSTEVRGKSLSSIEISREIRSPHIEVDERTREYDIMIVMESPGEYDDKSGTIGNDRSFQTLIQLCNKAGLTSKRVYVTYLVKCKPNFRKPQVKEMKACLSHIFKEIEDVKPKVIMPLGAFPLRLFGLHNKGGVNAVRGEVYSLPLKNTLDGDSTEYKVVPSVDPGFFHYSTDPKVESRILNDYRLAKTVALGKSVQKTTYRSNFLVIENMTHLDVLINRLENHDFFAWDTESRGLPYTKEPLMCLSFCWDYGPYKSDYPYQAAVLPLYKHDPDGTDWKLKPVWDCNELQTVKTKLREIFENPNIPKAAHNIKYDINVIRKHLGIKLRGFTFDTMLMHHILNEQKPHGLEYLADLEFGIGDYSKQLHEITGIGKVLKNTYDHIPDNLLWPYAANDAECTFRLTKLYYNKLQEKPHLWKLYCDEVEPLTHTLADAEWHGHYINKQTLNNLVDDYSNLKRDTLKDIENKTWTNFNPLSPKDTKKAFIDLGYEEKIKDKKKALGYNTSKERLLEIKDECPLADDILKYRNITKIIGTYLENVKNDIDKDDRVRYNWLIHGTESGRLSAKFYHQIPRADKKRSEEGKSNLRDMLAAPRGRKLVYFDYSQIELRVLAILSNDKEMLRLFKEDEDIHRATTATVLGIREEDVSEFNRQLGKAVNFGLAYGSEGYQLVKKGVWRDENQVEHAFTWEMLDRGMARYKSRFTGLMDYLENVPIITRNQGNIYKTPFGRERRIGVKINDPKESIRKAAEREVVNFSIQSTAGAITCRTINIIHQYLVNWRNKNLIKEDDIFLVNTVHDSGVWEIEESLVKKFETTLRRVAQRKIPELKGYEFPCDIGVGQTWSEAEENSKDEIK